MAKRPKEKLHPTSYRLKGRKAVERKWNILKNIWINILGLLGVFSLSAAFRSKRSLMQFFSSIRHFLSVSAPPQFLLQNRHSQNFIHYMSKQINFQSINSCHHVLSAFPIVCLESQPKYFYDCDIKIAKGCPSCHWMRSLWTLKIHLIESFLA